MAKLVFKDDEKSLLRRCDGQTVEQKRPFIQPEQKIAGHADFRPRQTSRAAAHIHEFARRAGQPLGERHVDLAVGAAEKAGKEQPVIEIEHLRQCLSPNGGDGDCAKTLVGRAERRQNSGSQTLNVMIRQGKGKGKIIHCNDQKLLVMQKKTKRSLGFPETPLHQDLQRDFNADGAPHQLDFADVHGLRIQIAVAALQQNF